jgi:hypothetical protein
MRGAGMGGGRKFTLEATEHVRCCGAGIMEAGGAFGGFAKAGKLGGGDGAGVRPRRSSLELASQGEQRFRSPQLMGDYGPCL